VKHPDFVMVEYAVNDGGQPLAAETLEGVVRQILKQPNQPAVMLLFMMDQAGHNVQDQHQPIGEHYKLPMASFRDALWPEVQAGRIPWNVIEADGVHPNDLGHDYAARFIINILQKALDTRPPDSQLPKIAALPAPKTANAFEHTHLFNADTLKPTLNKGWKTLEKSGFESFFGPGWQCDAPGSTIEFPIEGNTVSVLFYRVKGATGIAEARVDDGPPVRMDAWFDQTWGGYTPFQLIARDLPAGKHTLKITVIEEKNPGSTGHEFRIQAIMTAEKE
jgi:hypothetical protein